MPQTKNEIIDLANKKEWDKIDTDAITDPALIEAVKLRYAALVEPICNQDYDLALRRAIYTKMTSIVPLLIANRHNINAGSKSMKGRTPLHFAAENGLTDVIDMLVEAGAYPNICDDEGNTPAHLACLNNHPNAAMALAKHGVYTVQNYAGKTPYSLVTPALSASFLEFRSACQKNAMFKAKLPSTMGTKFHTLGAPGNALLGLIIQKDSTGVTDNTMSALSQSAYDKFAQIASLNNVPHLTVREYVDFDKKYKDVLPMHLTQAVKRYGSFNNDAVLVTGSYEQVKNLLEAARNWDIIEAKLNTPTQFIVADFKLNTFVMKIKPPFASFTAALLNSKYYTRAEDGSLLIHSRDFNELIAELNDSQTMDSFYTEQLTQQQNTTLINEKTQLHFIPRCRADHFVDATLELEADKKEQTVGALKKWNIPHVLRFFDRKEHIVIPEVNVGEEVDNYLPNLREGLN